MLPFDINSIVFHFDDFNYGRRSQPYFILTIATQLFFFIAYNKMKKYISYRPILVSSSAMTLIMYILRSYQFRNFLVLTLKK